jgi:2-oxoglutarate dehydrogenase E1 component
MTPKSLLRLHAASSAIEEFTQGGFQPLLEDTLTDRSTLDRVILCSGKVYYDLIESRGESKNNAIVRVEQFYPFPTSALKKVILSYPKAREIVWCQEEPQNMGGWSFMRPRLESLGTNLPIRYVGRTSSASPATGFYAIHELEQKNLIADALGNL